MCRMFHFINQKQRSWAGIYGKILNPPVPDDNTQLYVSKLNDNLCIPLSNKSESEFNNAPGNELSGKMNALYSSSAFTVNVFEYWKQRFENQFIFQTLLPYDKKLACDNANNEIKPILDTLMNILKLSNLRIIDIAYEKENIIYETAHEHPRLDINFECDGNSLKDIGIECKYRESFFKIFYKEKNCDWNSFSKYYLETSKPIWNGLQNLKNFASNSPDFIYLDIPQLIRHILGLNKKYNNIKDKYLLIYLYCPSYFEDNAEYIKEINIFSNVLSNDGVQFFPLTYYALFDVLFQNILKTNTVNDLNYMNYIIERYL